MTVRILKSSSVVPPEMYVCESREQARELWADIAALMAGEGLELVWGGAHHMSFRNDSGSFWSFTIVEDVAPSRWWKPASAGVAA